MPTLKSFVPSKQTFSKVECIDHFMPKEKSCKEITVRLFGNQECPKISLTSNPRQNCRIGQPFSKKWFFSPDQFGPRRKRKGKSGEIRSLLETLGSTLQPPKKFYLPKSYIKFNSFFIKKFCTTLPSRGSLSKFQ